MSSMFDAAARHNLMQRIWSPFGDLLAPQLSSAARERRDTLVLLVAVFLVMIPHVGDLTLWEIAAIATLFFWRLALTIAQRPLPGRIIMLPMLVAAVAAIYAQHRTLVGRDAGVSFLLVLMALKLMEMRARRDVFVVIFLSFFVLLTEFLYSQELPIAAVTLVAVALLFFTLVSVNLDEADLPAAGKAKLVGGVMLKALPLMLVMFVLFPRISGPLWGSPGDASSGTTGLSNSMAPGSVGQLLESNEIAFRAQFDGAPPANDKLYWRGPVFSFFNGRAWLPAETMRAASPSSQVEADVASAVAYRITLEPQRRDWMFALDLPTSLPVVDGLQPRFGAEMQLLAGALIAQRTRYSMRSFTRYRYAANALSYDLQAAKQLPRGYNPRTAQYAAELAAKLAPPGATTPADLDAQLVNAVLSDLRKGGYVYTLDPPLLGRNSIDEFLFDTRQGFCEHYSSAFVYLMRVLGVPARVVTGYQGGELNPVDGFLIVRQSDAHAWAEVWLKGRGWVRVDPTAVVALSRVERVARDAVSQTGIAPLFYRSGAGQWLQTLRYNWEAAQNGWNQWVLSYSQERQRALAEMLGIDPDWRGIAIALTVCMGVLLTILGAASMRHKVERDPLGEIMTRLRRKLIAAGVDAAQWRGPRDLAALSRAALAPTDADAAERLLRDIEQLRYAAAPGSVRASALRGALRAFRPSRVRAA